MFRRFAFFKKYENSFSYLFAMRTLWCIPCEGSISNFFLDQTPRFPSKFHPKLRYVFTKSKLISVEVWHGISKLLTCIYRLILQDICHNLRTLIFLPAPIL